MSSKNKKENGVNDIQAGLNAAEGSKKADQGRPLADEFPYLNKQVGLQRDVQEDLMLTDREFGKKHKRGKIARRELLQNLENRLELLALRSRVDDYKNLDKQFQHLLSANEAGLIQSASIPLNLRQAEVVLWLSALTLDGTATKFIFDVEVLVDELRTICSDHLSIDILRNLVINNCGMLTAQQIADREGRGRQAIYDRQDRIISRLNRLIENADYKKFVEALEASTCITNSDRMIASISHPLAAISLLQPDKFPSISDVVATGYWLIARRHNDGKKSFRRAQRGDSNHLELLLHH
jgi:hypothetical protein